MSETTAEVQQNDYQYTFTLQTPEGDSSEKNLAKSTLIIEAEHIDTTEMWRHCVQPIDTDSAASEKLQSGSPQLGPSSLFSIVKDYEMGKLKECEVVFPKATSVPERSKGTSLNIQINIFHPLPEYRITHNLDLEQVEMDELEIQGRQIMHLRNTVKTQGAKVETLEKLVEKMVQVMKDKGFEVNSDETS